MSWYRRCVRWGQTNITEVDAERYDLDDWRRYWRDTRVQGVIVNAGGIVAYYPSRFELQYRAHHLGDRDLFGEVSAAAREEGLAVVARMDSNRVQEPFYKAHPDWFAVDRDGRPFRAGPFYLLCVNGPYYEQFIPDVLREIIERYRPDGFTDNSWMGPRRDRICHCTHCQKRFGRLPAAVDWDDPVYREWVRGNYARRLEIWDLNNRVTREAGGPDCLWIGMISGHLDDQAQSFRGTRAICKRTEIVFLDHQGRSRTTGFENNGDAGKQLHGLAGWDTLIPESMAMYRFRAPTFRLSAAPPAEARTWMVEGFAGGIQPWWHFIAAHHEDRRHRDTPVDLCRWHEKNEAHLTARKPVASVGVVWSQENLDLYGREQAYERCLLPYHGFTRALIRARIPYVPVHADDVEAAEAPVLVLPDLGVLSDGQASAIRRAVEKGAALVATGESSLYDATGKRRDDFPLADLFGAHHEGGHEGGIDTARPSWESADRHTYLRSSDHEVLAGFKRAGILPFGGKLERVRASGAEVPLTFVPPFPIYPPETSWMSEPVTDTPALILNGRVSYLPADLDRMYGRHAMPDHGDLLAAIVRRAIGDRQVLRVDGEGLLDCHLYEKEGRWILHLVNLSGVGVGPFQVRVRREGRVRLLVSEETVEAHVQEGWATFEVSGIREHEVAVIG